MVRRKTVSEVALSLEGDAVESAWGIDRLRLLPEHWWYSMGGRGVRQSNPSTMPEGGPLQSLNDMKYLLIPQEAQFQEPPPTLWYTQSMVPPKW